MRRFVLVSSTSARRMFPGRSLVHTSPPVMFSQPPQELAGDQDIRDLPGLSREQITKIGDTDHLLRTRHMQIEAELSPEERDHARVRVYFIVFYVPSQLTPSPLPRGSA